MESPIRPINPFICSEKYEESVENLYDNIVSSEDKKKLDTDDLLKKIFGQSEGIGQETSDYVRQILNLHPEIQTKEQEKIVRTVKKLLKNPEKLKKEDKFIFNSFVQAIEKNRVESPISIDTAVEALKKNSRLIGTNPYFLQVPVGLQIYDKTNLGNQNCGYHTLKNALCSLATIKEGAPENLFKDEELFLDFYNHYCAPLLEKTEKNARNATFPILREILANIEKDANVPLRLKFIQKIPGEESINDKIGFFSVQPTNDSKGIEFGLFDQKGLEDTFKLYEFAKSPYSQALACCLGDSSSGHWCEISIVKNDRNELYFFGSDSFDNQHIGNSSLLGKLSLLLEESIKNPESLMIKALNSFTETLASRCDLINDEGDLNREEEKNLLLNEKEELVNGCLTATEVILSIDWSNTTDISTLLNLKRISSLLKFLTLNLSREEVFYQVLQDRFEKIQTHFSFEASVLKALTTSVSELNEILPNRSEIKRNIQQTLATFKSIETLYKERSIISSGTSQIDREIIAQGLTSAGIEPGFMTGQTSNDSKKQIEQKVYTLLMAYQTAKSLDQTEKLYETIGQGDGCLTARMGRIEEFLSELKSLGDISQDFSTEAIMQLSDAAVSSAIMEHSFGETDINSLKKEDLDINALITCFSIFSQVEKAEPFKDFLIDQGWIEDKNKIDWKLVVENLIASPLFEVMLNRGKEIAKRF